MLFNSWTFLIFLLVVFLGYYFGPGRVSRSAAGQIGWLTLASFVFYGWHSPWLVILLAVSTFINAEVGRRLLDPEATQASRKRALVAALAFNLTALGFFKYASLFARLLLPESLQERWGPFLNHIPLPIGISFYTFQGISLVMDLYRAGEQGVPGASFHTGCERLFGFKNAPGFSNPFFRNSFPDRSSRRTSFFIRLVSRRYGMWIGMAPSRT